MSKNTTRNRLRASTTLSTAAQKQKDQIPNETFATRRKRVQRQGHQARQRPRGRGAARRDGDSDPDPDPPAKPTKPGTAHRPGKVVPLKPAVAAKPGRDASQPNPFRIYRVKRLAELFDVDPSTIWRWTKSGVLPPPVQIGPTIHGWTERQLAPLMEARLQASE
jgi:predicted DNA-binding transcriptional regulator AlpA